MPGIKEIPGLITGSTLKKLRGSAADFVSKNRDYHKQATEHIKQVRSQYKNPKTIEMLAGQEAKEVSSYREGLRGYEEKIKQTSKLTRNARIGVGAGLAGLAAAAVIAKRKKDVKSMTKKSSYEEIVKEAFVDEITKIADSYNMGENKGSGAGKVIGLLAGAALGGFAGRAIGRRLAQGFGQNVGIGVRRGLMQRGATAAEAMQAASKAGLKSQKYFPLATMGIGTLAGGSIGKSIGN